jgi:putative transposase
LPRNKYVQEGEEGVYHCFSRCVRRAFLYGFDALTGRDFSHRKVWLVARLRQLAAKFAVEVCAYAVMENHYHCILRTRPDIAASWSDREVATRWLALFSRHCRKRNVQMLSVEDQIRILAHCPERIAQLRQRLSSLSWFMGRLNEFIARAANKEDAVKGRFWESRFKCQALLDEAAIAACMVYVDLNPIRAGLAETPEQSEFTSIQERIRCWQKEKSMIASVLCEMPQDAQSGRRIIDIPIPGTETKHLSHAPESISTARNSLASCWLCPIETNGRGILQMTAAE